MPRSRGGVDQDLIDHIRRLLSAATDRKIGAGAKTLAEIASDVGVDVNTLRRYKDGRIKDLPLDVAIRWAESVGVSTATWREEVRRRDPLMQVLHQLEQLPTETAQRVTERMAAVSGRPFSVETSETWVDDFSKELHYDEIVRASASALIGSARRRERNRMQKAMAKLDPKTLEAIVHHAAREILDRFIIYIKSKSVTR